MVLPPGGGEYFMQLFVANWLLDVSILMLQRRSGSEMSPLYYPTRKGRLAIYLHERLPPQSAYVMGAAAILWYCSLLGAIIAPWFYQAVSTLLLDPSTRTVPPSGVPGDVDAGAGGLPFVFTVGDVRT